MKNDFILDLVETFGKNLGKELFNEKDDILPITIENLSDKDILTIHLKKLILQGKYNDAEDFLFFAINDATNSFIDEVGAWFYQTLEKEPIESLTKNNFSYKEIKQGRIEFQNLRNKQKNS